VAAQPVLQALMTSGITCIRNSTGIVPLGAASPGMRGQQRALSAAPGASAPLERSGYDHARSNRSVSIQVSSRADRRRLPRHRTRPSRPRLVEWR
jgi:hypothetical protein